MIHGIMDSLIQGGELELDLNFDVDILYTKRKKKKKSNQINQEISFFIETMNK